MMFATPARPVLATLTLALFAATAAAQANDPTRLQTEVETTARTTASAGSPGAPTPLGFGSVTEALTALTARDGNGTVVAHADDGWVIINEPMAAAQWSFTPKGHAAHPSVVRHIIRRSGPRAEVSVDVAMLCEAGAAACDGLRAEFERNE